MFDGLDELGTKRLEEVDGHSVGYDPRARFVGSVPEDGPVILSCRAKDYAEIGVQAALTGAVTLKLLSDAQIAEYFATCRTCIRPSQRIRSFEIWSVLLCCYRS